MKMHGSLALILAGLTGCASANSAAVPPDLAPAQPEVVAEFPGAQMFPPVRTWRFMKPQAPPAIIINVSTPWTRGRSSLLKPAPRCPRSILRLDRSGKTVAPIHPLEAASRPAPTINSPCFGAVAAPVTKPR